MRVFETFLFVRETFPLPVCLCECWFDDGREQISRLFVRLPLDFFCTFVDLDRGGVLNGIHGVYTFLPNGRSIFPANLPVDLPQQKGAVVVSRPDALKWAIFSIRHTHAKLLLLV